jgi:DNA-binding NarL/FixJ family response regulator
LGAALPPNDEAASGNAPAAPAGVHVFLAALRPPGPCGIEWTRRLQAFDGSARFVLLAEQADAALGFSALYSGASAFLLLPLNGDDLLTAIQRAAAGRHFLPAAAVEASLDALCQAEPLPSCTGLTPTEIRVLWAMGQGRGEKGAARLLDMPINTIHTHANHAYPKLGVHNLEDALHEVFGKRACAFACLGRERERERERESRGRGDEVRGRT